MQQLLRRGTTAAFNHQDRLVSRGAARGGNKPARVAEMLKVEQNGAGFAVAGQKVQQVIDIYIQTITQRDKVGKPHLALLRPIKDGVGDGSRLRDKGQFTAMDRHRRKAGVQPLPRRQQAETVGAEQAHLMAGGARQQRRILLRLRRKNDAGLAAFLPQGFKQLEITPRVGTEYRQIRRKGQALDGGPRQHPEHRLPGGGHRQHRAIEATG